MPQSLQPQQSTLDEGAGLVDLGAPPPDYAGATDDFSRVAARPDLAGATGNPDFATPPPDLATVLDFTVPTSACHPLVNEILTSTTQSAAEEWVEIFNPCSTTIDLNGWKLVYRAASNSNPPDPTGDDTVLFAWSGSISAGGYLVYGGSGYHGPVTAALLGGIADNGALAIRGAGGAVVDSVAYGAVSTGNAFIVKAHAPAPMRVASPGSSIARLPNGADTANNSVDFAYPPSVTPGAPNR